MSEENGHSWPAAGVEPRVHPPDVDQPDEGMPSILELAGLDLPGVQEQVGDLSPAGPVAGDSRPEPATDSNGSGDDQDSDHSQLQALLEAPATDGAPSVSDRDGGISDDGAPNGVADDGSAPAGAGDPDAVDQSASASALDRRVAGMAGRTEWDLSGTSQARTHPRPAAVRDPRPVLDETPDLTTVPVPNGGPGPAAPPARIPLPRFMAIANQKGGVGKTTTAVNLGASLAELGYRVLVVDLDPQGNATTGLGINGRNLQSSIYDVLLADLPMVDCIEPTGVRNLFVAPATIDLAGAEIELVPVFSRELRLRRALESLGDDFDFVLIDCPPSLGLLTVNGLAAATEVVVPIQCEYYALEGLGQLMRNVQLVQRNLNPRLELSSIILTMYDARTKLAEQVAKEVRKHFGAKVCRNIVPRTVRLSEAPSFGQPIIVFDSTSRGALAYRELAKEVSGGAPQRTR